MSFIITDLVLIMNENNPCILFGRKVRQKRELQSLSQEQLAELSGLDRTYISGVERGKRNISLNNIFRIAKALNLPAYRLLDF